MWKMNPVGRYPILGLNHRLAMRQRTYLLPRNCREIVVNVDLVVCSLPHQLFYLDILALSSWWRLYVLFKLSIYRKLFWWRYSAVALRKKSRYIYQHIYPTKSRALIGLTKCNRTRWVRVPYLTHSLSALLPKYLPAINRAKYRRP